MELEKSIVQVAMNRHGVLSRRGFLSNVGFGAGAAGLATLSFPDLVAAQTEALRKRNMAVILLWMTGGPSQFETFDPKPDHANGGGTKAIETAVPGIRIAQGWEKTAAAMKDICLIRSMTSKEGNHQRATYQLHTGYVPTASLKHPSFGSIVASELNDPKFDLPHFVSIGGPTVGAGFLGAAFDPFLINNPEEPPTDAKIMTDRGRFVRRRGLLNSLEQVGYGKAGGLDRVKEHRAIYDQSTKMVLSPNLKAFDLEGEESALRDAYGRSSFGQGCLLARRLVETGVTFVEVRSNGRGGNWDTHQDNFERVKALAGDVDPGFSTLVTDLKQRGLLDRTLVVWMGEFGRTPKVNPNSGRDHYPRCFNVALAGCGVKGGQVIGKSSANGSDPEGRPVAVNDLLRSFCQALKIDPTKENMSPIGRPIKIVDGGEVVKELFA